MFTGYKTYIGLVISILGLFGLGDLITADQLGQVIDLVLQLVGTLIAIYGNFKAHKKIDKLETKAAKKK